MRGVSNKHCLLTFFINSIRHEHSCKILYIFNVVLSFVSLVYFVSASGAGAGITKGAGLSKVTDILKVSLLTTDMGAFSKTVFENR